MLVTRANFSKAVRRLGLTRYEAALSALARPAIRIRPAPCKDDDIPLGGSKLGGEPDLPNGIDWPQWEGSPLNFIAQFDCGELQRFESAAPLPPDGLLSFFYDSVEQPWGHDPADARSACVLYLPATGTLERRANPPQIEANAQCRFGRPAFFHTNRLEFHEILTFPTEFDAEPQEIGPLTALFGHGANHREHQLFGYPNVIQNPMEEQCRVASHGVEAGDTAWRLLLQVDSIRDMMWGDMGMIYFWITEDALRAREFDRTWLVLQC